MRKDACRRNAGATAFAADYKRDYFMLRIPQRILYSVIFAAVLLRLDCADALAQSQQQHVHQMAADVMPFDISKVVHIFRMTESGGVEQVVSKDPAAADQIALIQQHLRKEAERFRRGDYSDPASLHGNDMPGLKELRTGASRIRVSYRPLQAGAEVAFETDDRHLLTAIHRWFGAQLSEHGADAKAE